MQWLGWWMDDGWQVVDEWKILGIGTAGSGHEGAWILKLFEARRNRRLTAK